ncbi:MAG: AIM24 family protein [Theionarchaea archaeon]|nr:AIM24 family protein [Theionarchaea archaeon]
MHHEIAGELSQWLKVILNEERIRADAACLLCRSGDITLERENIFSGTGWLFFTAQGKIKEFFLEDAETIIISKHSLLASHITVEQEDLSTQYLTLVKVCGPGSIFITGKGDFVEYFLEEEETAEVRTSSLTAIDTTVSFHMGSQFSRLTGPGAVILSSILDMEKKPEPSQTEFSLFDQL